ncbi:hypothetical protein, partial [Ilumatobacter sp.]|uniref:hypothetical protein n=1 Tax=Ilumatobacter sp. TaxID=1967498 RepID=UPI003AF78784
MSNESAASGRSRERTSTGLLVLVFLLGLVAGPALYMAEVVKDEDRFVALGERVIDEPAVRETVASEITKITFRSLETDEAIANVLPNGTRSLAVPITRFASEAFSDAAFSLIDTEVAVTAREAALREVHRQLLSDDDEEVVLDLRGVIVRTSREVAGPTIGTGVAKLMSDTDSGRYTVAREGSATSTIFSVVRATPDISLAIGLTSLALLAGGILVARDRRRALVRGGLAIAAAAVMSVLAVAIVINTAGVLAQSPIGPEASRGIAQAISSDFAIIQRFPMMVGLSLAAIGMLLGERKAAVALRALPALIWRRDARGAADAVESVVADNPALARLIVWIAGAMVLGSWPDPTRRVIVTVIVITLLAVGSIWMLTSEGRRAEKWRVAVGLPASTGSEVGASDAPRYQMAVVALVTVVFIFWPSWDRALVVSFFVIAAVLQAAIEVRPAWRSA